MRKKRRKKRAPVVVERKRVIVAVPTLTRYDLLVEMIASAQAGSRRPDGFYIVDNGGQLRPDTLPLVPNITIVGPSPGQGAQTHRGVAASWNLILQNNPGANVVIANDALIVPWAAVERMAEMADKAAGEPLQIHAWSPGEYQLFLQTPAVMERIGWFDEEFWPAQWEDDDYARRMKLAKIPRVQLYGAPPRDGAQTMRAASPRLRRALQAGEARGRRHYERKWGGYRGYERYTKPFDGATTE